MSGRFLLFFLPMAGLLAGAARGAADGGEGRAAVVRMVEQARGASNGMPRSSGAGKCGLQETFRLLNAWNDFTPAERAHITAILSPLQHQKDRVVGRFRLYYDTTGSNVPALLDANNRPIPGTAEAYVDSAGRFFNDAWTIEIDRLGFGAPPLDPDNSYHVEISNLTSGLYGRTWPDTPAVGGGNPARYRSHIEIDNDFSDDLYYTKGMAALKVTTAHEFHHAIQLGAYGYWPDDLYFYEVTSVWMEDEVHDDVNDYYQYLSNDLSRNSQFSHPEVRFTEYDGSIEYSRGIWGKFVEKRFGRGAMRRTWEYMRQYPSVPAIDRALTDLGEGLRVAFTEFAWWNLHTGPSISDEVAGEFYPEGRFYPAMRITARLDYVPPSVSIQRSLAALSSTYYDVCVLKSPTDSCGVQNQMEVIITNANLVSAMTDSRFEFTYTLSSAPLLGSRHLTNGLNALLEVPDPENWGVRETIPSVVGDILVFPDPFIVSGGNKITFRLPERPHSPTARLTIFGSSMNRIYSNDRPVEDFRPLEPAIRWDGRTDRGEPAASGVYFYIIVVDDKQFTGKFAATRE